MNARRENGFSVGILMFFLKIFRQINGSGRDTSLKFTKMCLEDEIKVQQCYV